MRTSLLWVAVAGALAVGACASASKDGGDKQPPAVHEIVSGGARLRGGKLRMDAVVGRAFVQPVTTGAKLVAKPAAAVTP